MNRASAVLVAMLVAPLAQSGSRNFIGTWVPIPAEYKSTKELKTLDLGAPPAAPAPVGPPQLPSIRISETDPAVVVEYIAADGAIISSFRLPTDGSESVDRRGAGLTQHSRTRWDNGVLQTDLRLLQGDTVVMTGVDRWQLSADGTRLTISGTMEDAKSRSRTTTVYRRQ